MSGSRTPADKRDGEPERGADGEHALIERFARLFGPRPPSLTVGIGDDAAVLEDGTILTTDVCVEGVHFRRSYLAPEDVGYRAVIAAVSDAAAMGGRPLWLLVTLGFSDDVSTAELDAVARGVAEAAVATGCCVAGGDLTRAPGLFVSVSVIGRTDGVPIGRGGGKPGDRLVVTGSLGGAAAALALHEHGPDGVRGVAAGDAAGLRARFRRPRAALEEAARLRSLGAHAMIDVSDGLGSEALHLSRGAGLDAVLVGAMVPIDPAAARVFGLLGRDPLREAIASGEEYVLLAALPGGKPDPTFPGASAGAFPVVGRLEPAKGNPSVWLEVDGKIERVTALGYRHR